MTQQEAQDLAAAEVQRSVLPDLTKARVIRETVAHVPLKEGAIDREVFTTQITEAVRQAAAEVNQALGGVGIPDYESKPGELAIGAYDLGAAFLAQVKAVSLTIVWSGVGSAILFKVVDLVIGLRVAPDQEREGLDLAEHGERAYNL